MGKRYWLMKTEPGTYSIEDLKKDKKTIWDGVRNYQARNIMMNDMQVGDEVLFYHSNAKPPGVAGLAKITKSAAPDPTAQEKKSKYYDPKATPEKPIWFCVEVGYQKGFDMSLMVLTMGQETSLSIYYSTKLATTRGILKNKKAHRSGLVYWVGSEP